MKRVPVTPDLTEIPAEFHPLFANCTVYDSSCSPEARVYYIEKDGGLFLKSAPKGTLANEAKMTTAFYRYGMGTELLAYLSEERDFLLTARAEGEDCTHAQYTDDPCRLTDTLAALLRTLHETEMPDCPVKNRTAAYLATVEEGYRIGRFDPSYAHRSVTAEEAYRLVCETASALKCDTLLHGDYCLPNIILNNWNFSAFIDLGNAGMGDRHIDLYWGAWTLAFNLGTDRYRDRFFDAYGREKVDPELIKLIGYAETFG